MGYSILENQRERTDVVEEYKILKITDPANKEIRHGYIAVNGEIPFEIIQSI